MQPFVESYGYRGFNGESQDMKPENKRGHPIGDGFCSAHISK